MQTTAWPKQWELPLAPHKASFMCISSTPFNRQQSYDVGGPQPQRWTSLKILDLFIVTSQTFLNMLKIVIE